ncbi:MAG TPA: rod shape-determining protein RodA [Gaiellaceae bacterium]|nr:rod shape-determining protein RodA [Gaiellaceae bacterium]
MATRVLQDHVRPHVAGELTAVLRHVDYVLLAAVAVLVGYGLWMLKSITRDDVPGDPSYFVTRQGINVTLGVIAFLAVAAVHPDFWRRSRRTLYVILILLLVVVFVADAVRGSQRWIEIGFFRFQPSELGKIMVAVCLGGFLADNHKEVTRLGTVLKAVALVGFPALLVFIEPDFGTALMYVAILGVGLFVAGATWSHLAALLATASVGAATLLWVLPGAGLDILKPYQVQRLTGFLNPDLDPAGTTYNITQSITAVGSGGLDGRGVEGATQTNLNYLPEHATDFIFSSLAEQRGFFGASILLLLYALIVWRGLKIVAIAPGIYGAVVAASLVFSLAVQVFVNIGMTIGIAPITGIPLPFVSYGGSSMIVSLMMIAMLEAIHIRGRMAGRS